MTLEALDAFLRALPGVTMDVLWEVDHVYKVGGKMFAVIGPSGSISFKAKDVAFEMLVETGAARPAPYMARLKWVLVDDPADFPEADLRHYLGDAHAQVAAKLTRRARRELGLEAQAG